MNRNFKETDLITKELIKRGCRARYLSDTDVIELIYKNSRLYFVKQYNALIPYVYGLNFESADLTRKFLEDAGITTIVKNKKLHKTYRVFAIKNGFMNVLRNNSSSFVQVVKKDKKLIILKKRIFDAFPHLEYVVFGVIKKSKKYYVTDFSISIGPNIKYLMTRGKVKRFPVDIIADLLIKKF